MKSMVDKEQKPYESIQQNSHSTNTFLTAFADYFSFLVTDGFALIEHLAPTVVARENDLKALQNKYDEIVQSAGKAVEMLEAIVEKKST